MEQIVIFGSPRAKLSEVALTKQKNQLHVGLGIWPLES